MVGVGFIRKETQYIRVKEISKGICTKTKVNVKIILKNFVRSWTEIGRKSMIGLTYITKLRGKEDDLHEEGVPFCLTPSY